MMTLNLLPVMDMDSAVYVDNNATTPVAKEVAQVISETLLSAWGNPSSQHPAGRAARAAVDLARRQVARLVGAHDDQDIVFVSGGTEANAWVLERGLPSVKHIITSNIEHPSVELPCQRLRDSHSASVTIVEATNGVVTAESVVEAARKVYAGVQEGERVLVSVMLANNETGIIMPVGDMARQLKALFPSILVHTDAAQAIGKIPVDVSALAVDFLTIVGHKFYGPRVGALYARNRALLQPLFVGGGQETGLRAGTENVAMIAGLGAAAALVTEQLDTHALEMRRTRDALEEGLRAALGASRVVVNGAHALRLPNTCNIALLDITQSGAHLLAALPGVFASTGAACHAHGGASKTLIRSGVSHECALKALRLSVGRETTLDHITLLINRITQALKSQ